MIYFITDDSKCDDKFNNIINYCNKLKYDDILCYINKDAIILNNSEVILNKFLSFDSKLVIGKDYEYINFLDKYIRDKTNNRCKKYFISMDFFIGRVEYILKFINDIKKYQKKNIKYIITKICNTNKYIKVDIDNILFRNYNLEKELNFSDNKASIILLKKKKNIKISDIIPETIIFLIIISLIIFYKNKFNKFIIILNIIFELFNYQLIIKHSEVNITNKIIYYLIHYIHTIIISIIYYLIYKNITEPSSNLILLLNVLYFIIILSFFIFKRCILTIFENYFINDDEHFYLNIIDVYNYIINEFSINNSTELDKKYFTYKWMKGNIIIILVIIILNIYILYNNIYI